MATSALQDNEKTCQDKKRVDGDLAASTIDKMSSIERSKDADDFFMSLTNDDSAQIFEMRNEADG